MANMVIDKMEIAPAKTDASPPPSARRRAPAYIRDPFLWAAVVVLAVIILLAAAAP